MRKIDGKTHRRFIAALESMIRDMDALGFTDAADELVVSHCELEEIYRHYNRKVEELNQLATAYLSLFEEKHSEYFNASRLRQKEQTRIRHKEKNESARNQKLPVTTVKNAL
ncbi:MAG: hypothetical protein VB074_00800 [Proteiniphilum sp.]|uniref:hypothetical protein n=1 Tax=Proteiniphilum sp. TaxID=1926877 RepID=UPI002687E2A6|nr:hypothetical protein [Proteiniphilum sp.]MEA5126699.1 hypothetical protein [Proteiniphilum sp.]